MSGLIKGFEPYYFADSRVLVLGSFPSVKSRQQSFYYGNPQNAFWRIVATFFKEGVPKTVDDKKDFLARNKLALYDVVSECEIVGSMDSAIKNYKVANVAALLQNSQIKYILINGGRAYSIYKKHFKDLPVTVIGLPSTSPANARRDDGEWYSALQKAFSRA